DGGGLEALLAGLATGFVFCTRPVSSLPIAIIVAWLLRPTPTPTARRSRLLVVAIMGALPGLFLLLLSQRAIAGSWLASTQRLYYTISDGPPGCFRWGFGKGTGCIFEHGEFVDARLKNGYGLIEAAGTTLRRLHKHLLDVANFEPLALLVLLPVLLRARHATNASSIVPATVLVGLQMLAYVPFYFDGDYPGGGARFFADVLPVEHALVMIGVASIVVGDPARHEWTKRAFTRCALGVLALSAAGFAVHASYEHGKLRDRDGGRPMFEPDVLARASLTSGLVFVDTDHGFALGHDPSARPTNRVVVARLRNDHRDRMLFDELKRPPTYLYTLTPPVPPSTESTPTLVPWAPPEAGTSLRFETEAEWPPIAQEHGFAAPVWASSCASGTRALVLTPEPGQRATATIHLPVPTAGRWAVEVHVVHGAYVPFANRSTTTPVEGAIKIGPQRWTWRPQNACAVLPAKELDLQPPHAEVTIEATGGPVGVDYLSLRKVQ
ncbi:MAG TPA: hypothetical protein VM580_34800, partial [Labilithrix sp.]|nr:hypothetical protein [Labilithrix sp.]